MSLYFRAFLFKIFRHVWIFLYYRINKEYEYLFSSGERHGVKGSVREDFFVQEIVDSLTKERRDDYDPYIIEDSMYTWFRIPLIVEVEHLKTFVNGLKSLHKAETCEIIEKNSQLYANATLGAGPIHFNTFSFAKTAYSEQLVTFKASLKYCKVNVHFSVDTETGRTGSLQSLCVEDFSGVNVCITGLGCFSWFLSNFLTFMIKLNQRIVTSFVEFEIECYVNQFLPDYCFPTECENIKNASISESYDDTSALNKVDKILLESSSKAKNKFVLKNTGNITKDEHQTNCKGSSKKNVSKEYLSEDVLINIKLEKDCCYTNVPLLEGNTGNNEANHGNNESESDADNIRLEFKFSKNNVLLEDLEPLAKRDMTTCCVFFRSDTEFLKKFSSTETGKNLTFKHSKDFLKGLLTTCDTSDISGESMLLEQLEQTYAKVERARSCNERLMETFVKDYPNFIALTCMCDEQILETEDPIKKSTRNAFQCSSLPMDNTSDYIESEINTISNKICVQGVTRSLKHMKDNCDDAISEALQNNALSIDASSNDSDGKDHKIFKPVEDIEKVKRAQNIESILKWNLNSEDIEESNCFETKKFRYQIKEVSKSSVPGDFNVSKMIPDNPMKIRKERAKTKNLKDNLYDSVIKKTHENQDIAQKKGNVRKGKKLKNSTGLRRKNVNESILKYKYTSIEQLNVIGDTICKCFENPWVETSLENTFFLTDNESCTISDLMKRQQSELAEQLYLLEDIKEREMRNETDHFELNLDAILKEAQLKFWDTPYKSSHTTEIHPSIQSKTTNSKAFDISKLVKNFFDQNPMEKFLNEPKKDIHPHIGTDNKSINESNPLSLASRENALNLSMSPKLDYCSNIIKIQLSDLIHEPLDESPTSLTVVTFDSSPKDSNNNASMDSDVSTQSARSVINEELNWWDILYPDGSCDSSFSNYADILNISANSDKSALCGKYNLVPETDSIKNKTGVINRKSTEASAREETILVSNNSSYVLNAEDDISKDLSSLADDVVEQCNEIAEKSQIEKDKQEEKDSP